MKRPAPEPRAQRPVPYCTYVVAKDNPARPDRKRFCGKPACWWESRCHQHVTSPEPKDTAA